MKNYTYHHIFQLKIGELKKGFTQQQQFHSWWLLSIKKCFKMYTHTHTCTTHMDEIYYLIFNGVRERDYCYYFGKHISSGFDCLLSSRGNFFTLRIFNILMYACNLVIDVKLIVRKDGEKANRDRAKTTMMFLMRELRVCLNYEKKIK